MTRDQEWLEDCLRAVSLVCLNDELPHTVSISWHKYRKAKRPRLADYLDHKIRISQALQSEKVPVFFVMYVIYHEALHALMGHDHGPVFLMAERLFPRYADAIAWELENIDELYK